MHEYLKTAPFDLYELYLFHLVVRHRSFTKAAEVAGLTQSAVTRQIQGMEHRLNVALLERTTRDVRITPAGEFLDREGMRLIGDVEHSLQQLRERFADAKKEVRVGVSRSIGLSYLPGFFHANLRRLPQVTCRVSSSASADILLALEANELDLGVLCPPASLPKNLRVTHRFTDAFTLIGSPALAAEFSTQPKSKKACADWLARQSWLTLAESSQTGQLLQAWTKAQGWALQPAMRLDSFDLIISIVSLGMGMGFVPIRSLALYHRKPGLKRIALPGRFERELVVVARKHPKPAPHLTEFIGNILFQ